MRVCERCGIEYDNPGDWCDDCNEVENVTNYWALQGYAATNPVVVAQKTQDINDLWLNQWTDLQIAEYLGISPRTVLRWRQRLNLPATNHGGTRFKSPREQERDINRMRAHAAAPGWGYLGNSRAKELGVGWFRHKGSNTTRGILEATTK